MRKNVHLLKNHWHVFLCAQETALEQLTDSVYSPSIMKVLGLTSWQGVVTLIMLSGSFPCNHNVSLTQLSDTNAGYTVCTLLMIWLSVREFRPMVPYRKAHHSPQIGWSVLLGTSPVVCHSVPVGIRLYSCKLACVCVCVVVLHFSNGTVFNYY